MQGRFAWPSLLEMVAAAKLGAQLWRLLAKAFTGGKQSEGPGLARSPCDGASGQVRWRRPEKPQGLWHLSTSRLSPVSGDDAGPGTVDFT